MMLAQARTFLRSDQAFVWMAGLVVLSLFLNAGFLTAATVVFLIYSLFNVGAGSHDSRLQNRILLLPALLFLIMVVWALPSGFSQEAVTLLIRKIPLLLFPLAFFFMSRKPSSLDRQRVLEILLVCTILCSWVCYGNAVLQVIEHRSFVVETADRPYYYFSYSLLTDPVHIDPIYLGMFCNLALVSALTTPFLKKPLWRILAVVYLAIFIFLISSKMGIIGMATIGLIWLIMKNKRKAILYVPLVVILFAGVINFPFLKDRFIASTKFNYTEPYGHLWNSTTFRLAIWTCSMETFLRHPAVGYGTASGQDALEVTYREKGFIWGLRDRYNPHSEFFSTALDTGVTGLTVLLAMLAMPFSVAIRKKAFIPIAFILITLLSFAIESVLLRQKGVVFFSFFFCLLFAKAVDHKEATT